MELLTKTNNTFSVDFENGGWPRPGDAVDTATFNYFLEVLPPAHLSRALVQIGSPADHNGPGRAARYDTLQRCGSRWYYTGLRCRGERVAIEDPDSGVQV